MLRLQRMAVESQIMEQAPEVEEVLLARAIGQRRMLLAEVTEPAEQVGIAAQLREVQDLREVGLQKGEEAMGRKSIAVYRTGTQGGGENLNVSVKKLLAWMGRWGRRVWVAARARREILGQDQVGLEGMAGSG